MKKRIYEYRFDYTPKFYELVAVATMVASQTGSRIDYKADGNSDITPLGTIDYFVFEDGNYFRVFCGSNGYVSVETNSKIGKGAVANKFYSVLPDEYMEGE